MWFWISVTVLLGAAFLWAWRIDRRHPGLTVTRRKGKVEVSQANAVLQADLRNRLPGAGGLGDGQR